jgi:hypothetical protein
VSWKNSAAIDSIRHPEGSDWCHLFTAVIGNNLDFAKANNAIQIEEVAANRMAFTRMATVQLFNADDTMSTKMPSGWVAMVFGECW